MQSDKDKANMTLRAAGPAAPTPANKGKAAGKEKASIVEDEAEIGRLNFDATSASLPFKAQLIKNRGGKAKRIQDDMRKNEIEQRKVRKAEASGKGDEVKKDIAMQKALKRARGEE